MTVTIARRHHAARPKTPAKRCWRCQTKVRWLRLDDGTRWRFDPQPVDPRDHASPPAYPVWRGRAWRVDRLVTYLTEHFDLTEEQALLIVDRATWIKLHSCGGGL